MNRFLFLVFVLLTGAKVAADTADVSLYGYSVWLQMSETQKYTFVAGYIAGSYAEAYLVSSWGSHGTSSEDASKAMRFVPLHTAEEIVKEVDEAYLDPTWQSVPIWKVIEFEEVRQP